MTDDTDDGNVTLSVDTLDNQSTMAKAEETTQLDERHIATDVGRGIQPPYNPETLAAFQELNETHQACIRKKARYEAGYGFDIVPHPSADEPDTGEGTQHQDVRDFWYGSDSRWQIGPEGTAMSTPEEVLELGRQDYHGIGWASLEILVEGDGTPIGLAHVPSATVRVRKTTVQEREDGDDIIESGHGYVQIRQGRRRYFGEAGDRYGDDPTFVDKETGETASDAGDLPNGPANELIFIPNPSPLSLYYGIPDWVAAMQTMGADQAAKEWNHDIFENLGIPYYAIKVTGGTLTEDSKEELRELMDNLKGSRYRTAILEVEDFEFEEDNPLQDGDPSDVEITLEPIGSREDLDMEFEAFRERAEHEIAKVHEVPPILINVTSTSNRSNSEAQVQEFANDVIAPEQSKFEARLYSIIHQQALGVDDWTIDFELRGGNNPQEEARMAEQRVRAMRLAGVGTVNEAREELGLEPFEDEDLGGMTLQEFEAEFSDDGVGGEDDDVEEMLTRSKAAPPPENKIGERKSLNIDVEKDPIEQTTFNSSNLDEGLYDFGAGELYLSFQRPDGQNSLYVYVDVPPSVWNELVNAGSAGSYHYDNIRLEYPYLEITNNHERLPEGPTPDPGEVPDDIPSDI
ncbi:phage portal protein [Halorubrum halodurans]|uniref:Chromosome partitioning protein ParB n=1 Tax=Halorubrum halodurans TaxID=1383851 RepID=A0A256INM4_9EURY|nr:phage portal protein [Halorubrum halodurans]OYR57717.1 chromosome partitioning protein ParB [Halorubrum halodurans]